jgi:hypothetical protein
MKGTWSTISSKINNKSEENAKEKKKEEVRKKPTTRGALTAF